MILQKESAATKNHFPVLSSFLQTLPGIKLLCVRLCRKDSNFLIVRSQSAVPGHGGPGKAARARTAHKGRLRRKIPMQHARTIRKFSFFCPAYKQKFYAGQCLGKPILDVPKYSMRLLRLDAYLR